MTIREAKEKDMVDYLSQIGHQPVKIQQPSYWYRSPFRDEKTPSFKVNRQRNQWFDFGEGKGGNLVDFGILYHRCSISEFLRKLGGSSLPVSEYFKTNTQDSTDGAPNKSLQITNVGPIVSLPLLRYLHLRRIPEMIGRQSCQEVHYSLKDKNYYALGFKNDSGGYELRNEYAKLSSSPKGTTLIDNGTKELAVFEGFFDFLSYRALYDKQLDHQRNFLILNSASFFEKSIPLMQTHDRVHLYLDTDKTGQKCTQQAIALDSQKFVDERGLYAKHGDLNDWLMHIGQSQRQRPQQKPGSF